MIKRFNILDRTQNIHSNYLLEASAGTGKTYSIENCVARLLVDENVPSTLESMLIVTFTKAATADLKQRIRNNLQKTLQALAHPDHLTPDYLIEILEKGEGSILYARQKLEQALAIFEQAPIFTIHGFCHRMLKEHLFEGDLGAALGSSEEGISSALIYRLIKDFFRLELHEELITQGQFQRLMDSLSGVDALEKELFLLTSQSIDIAPLTSIKALFQQVCDEVVYIRRAVKGSEEELYDDFVALAPYYNGILNRQGEIKPENSKKVRDFLSLLFKEKITLSDFDRLIADGLYLVEALDEENMNKRKKHPPEKWRCLELIPLIKHQLFPLISQARLPDFILCTLAFKCKELVKAYLDKKEIFGYDDLLTNMFKAIQEPSFASKIRERFTAAIIDEFQDTDPMQWSIFNTLFLSNQNKNSKVYLVGDPKQSIYGFRQADIYTYLKAGETLGKDKQAFLNVNYRSTKSFVEGINVLFSPVTAPGLMTLPRLKKTLEYQEVDSGELIEEKCFNDGRGAIHFFSYEEQAKVKGEKLPDSESVYFLPFIGYELQALQKQGVALNHCAILVSDRFQAMRVMKHLKNLDIPFVAQHAEDVMETLACHAMKELLYGILNAQNESALKVILGGPLIGWSHLDILTLNDSFELEKVMAKAMTLRKIWREQKFASFFQEFLSTSWHASGITVAEYLLRQEDGLELYHGIQQLAEILTDKESLEKLSPQRLFETFHELIFLQKDKEKSMKLRTNPEKEGVHILTIHSSKGLEFEIVIALGVIKRSKKLSARIPVLQENGSTLLTVIDNPNDARFLEYAMELDAEKIRQLYVAFTRAKQRLYIPLQFSLSGKCERGTASPIELYLAIMGGQQIPFQNLYERIEAMDPEKSLSYIQKLEEKYSITLSTNLIEADLEPQVHKNDAACLREVALPQIDTAPRYLHSFTSISQVIPREKKDVLLIAPPSDFQAHEKNMHTLPAGSQTGVFLHFLLEKISFSVIPEDDVLLEFVTQHAINTPFEAWSDPLAKMLKGALAMNFTFGTHSMSLSAIHSQNMFREHLFLYDSKKFSHSVLESKPGFVKGVIDLIFMHEGKYGIIDWKSNWLGPDASFYSEANMHQAMVENDYFLQADIYKEALRRYLRLIDDRPFEEIFGGMFYIFLRGVTDGKGIYAA